MEHEQEQNQHDANDELNSLRIDPVSEGKNGKLGQLVKKSKGYFIYLIFVLIFCQILDSYTSDGIPQRVTAVVTSFFPTLPFDQGLAIYTQAAVLISFGTYFALFNQWLADRFGRKILLIITTVFMALIPLLQIFIYNFWIYAGSAFFLAIVTQADIWNIYINEEAPQGKNAIWGSFVGLGGLFGAVLIIVMRGIFIPGDDPAKWYWRGMLYVSVILGIIMTLVIIFTVKETDAFLNKSAVISQDKKQIQLSFGKAMRIIFAPERRRAYIAILATGMIWACGMMFLKYTEPFMMQYSLVKSSEYNLIAIIGVLGLMIFSLVTGFLADKWGRRPTFTLYSILYPLMALLAILWSTQSTNTSVRIFVTGIFVAFIYGTGYGMWGLFSTVTIELMPTETRGMSLGLKTLFQAVAGTLIYLLLSYIIPILGLKLILIGSSALMCLICPIVLIFVPETKGRNLRAV